MEGTTRQPRCFVVLAEELNFTRAAARLYMAQQSLSSVIRTLEERVGVPLFERTKRSVRLTAGGEAFLEDVRVALAAVDRGAERAYRAQAGQVGTLRVGMLHSGGLELTGLVVDEFRRRCPDVRVEFAEFRYDDPSAGLATGLADVALVRPPISLSGVEHETLFVEPRVLVVAESHPLAERSEVSLAEILEVPLVVAKCDDRDWNDFWLLNEFRDEPVTGLHGEVVSTFEELEIVASGRACSVVPAGVCRYLPSSRLCFIRAPDIPPSPCAVAWRADRTNNPLVRQFVAGAQVVKERETELIEGIEHPDR